jgi:ankyrin repeat protein
MAESEQDPSITPLMREVSKGGQARLDQLRIMLSNPEHIATLFMKDSKGRTAIDWARLCRNTDAVAAVKAAMLAEINRSRLSNVQIGADYVTSTLTTNAKLRDELMAALRTRNIGAVSGVLAQNKLRREEVESLGEAFFTDAKDRSGYTPLILAAGQNLFDIVVLLLDMKVPVDNVNKFGHTAFTFSCSGGHASVAIMLLRRGANIHHKTEEGIVLP